MTNEEIRQRACEESKLRGLSPYTMDSYLKALTLFILHYEDRPIADMGRQRSGYFCSISSTPVRLLVLSTSTTVRYVSFSALF